MEEKLYKALKFICFLLMLAMVSIIFLQVLARYLFSNSLSWSEELGRFLFVWMTFLGAALALREKMHVALDLLIMKMPRPLQKICLSIGYLAMFLFTCVLIYGGYRFVAKSSHQISAAMQIPMIYVYLVLPVGGALILFYVIRSFYERVLARS